MDETHVGTAVARVRGERERVAAERNAYERFRRAVDSVEPIATTSARTNASTGAGTAVATGAASGERPAAPRCRRVREAYVDTVHDAITVADGDRSVTETIEAELGWELACAISTPNASTFSADLKRALLAAVAERQRELRALEGALETEARSLDAAGDAIADIGDALDRPDRTPPASLGFDGLRDRHDALARHRATCDRVAAERQAVLVDTTNQGLVGVGHRTLAATLYEELAVDHPVLATVARLDAVLDQRQRDVREHLVRQP